MVAVVLAGDGGQNAWMPRCMRCHWRGAMYPYDELGAMDAQAEGLSHVCSQSARERARAS